MIYLKKWWLSIAAMAMRGPMHFGAQNQLQISDLWPTSKTSLEIDFQDGIWFGRK